MNDYCTGIAYATGYFANDGNRKYLVVRNVDEWYIKNIAKETGYIAYESRYNFERDGRNQWVVKCKDIHELQKLNEIENIKDFCRAYIEIHGIIDMINTKDRKGNRIKRLRLRIYGKEDVLLFVNTVLPANEKKIQSIKNIVEGKYIGKTYALYYQSRAEILNILKWIDGNLKNFSVWDKWNKILTLT